MVSRHQEFTGSGRRICSPDTPVHPEYFRLCCIAASVGKCLSWVILTNPTSNNKIHNPAHYGRTSALVYATSVDHEWYWHRDTSPTRALPHRRMLACTILHGRMLRASWPCIPVGTHRFLWYKFFSSKSPECPEHDGKWQQHRKNRNQDRNHSDFYHKPT